MPGTEEVSNLVNAQGPKMADDVSRRRAQLGLEEGDHFLDVAIEGDKAIAILKDGVDCSEEQMYAALMKLLLIIHQNSNRIHADNANLEKKLVRAQAIAIKGTYGPWKVLGFQMLGAAIGLGAGFAGLMPRVAIPALSKVVNLAQYNPANPNGLLDFTKMILKSGQQFSQAVQIPATFYKESYECERSDRMSTKQLLETDLQESKRNQGKEAEMAAQILQQWIQTQDRHHQAKNPNS